MVFLDRVHDNFRRHAAFSAYAQDARRDDKWPIQITFWFVLSFSSFAWVAIIFAATAWLA
jgi:hypothetical protein